MRTRNKIVFSLFITIAIFLGGAIFYNQMIKSENSAQYNAKYAESVIIGNSSPHKPMTSTPARGVSKFDTRHEFSFRRDSIIEVSQPMQSTSAIARPNRSGSYRPSANYSGNSGIYSNNKQGSGSSSGGSSFLASGKKSGSSNDAGGYSSGGFSGSNLTPPAMVPFEQNSNVIMNMDPGSDPDHFIPVGDAPWLLALFSLLYAVVRITIRKR